MGKRPARCYTEIKGPAYTRIKKYIRSVPGSKIQIYDMGQKGKFFPVVLHLVIDEPCQIRHMALEALRQAVNRKLMKKVGRENYHFRVRVHPHHILRENKMMAFAGADRMQDGMRRSFGKPTDRAARVRAGQEIATIWVPPQHWKAAFEALDKARYKLPKPSHVIIAEGRELINR